MTSTGTMKNRIFRCDFDLTSEMTRIFFRVLNEKLVGVPVAEITPGFIQNLAASLGNWRYCFLPPCWRCWMWPVIPWRPASGSTGR